MQIIFIAKRQRLGIDKNLMGVKLIEKHSSIFSFVKRPKGKKINKYLSIFSRHLKYTACLFAWNVCPEKEKMKFIFHWVQNEINWNNPGTKICIHIFKKYEIYSLTAQYSTKISRQYNKFLLPGGSLFLEVGYTYG